MRLTLSAGGILGVGLAALLLGFGLLALSPTLLFLAACAALPPTLDVLLGIAAPARFREGRLRLGWRPAATRRRFEAGRPVEIELTVRNPSAVPLPIDRADVFAGSRVVADRRSFRLPALPPGHELRHVLRVTPLAPGTLVLHGLLLWIATPLGFFRHRLYFPTPLRLRVLPRSFAARLPRAAAARTDARGPLPRLRAPGLAGDDADLREIRDHRWGDPFRRIAWRPSARAGRLLTKEYERHLPRRHLVAVEASAATLRRVDGRAAFDALAAEAYARAEAALRAGDEVGLCLFDARVVRRLPATGARAAAAVMLDALLDAYHPVDRDATDVPADELAQIVGRYLLLHERIDTRVAVPGVSFHDRCAVAEAVLRLGLSSAAARRDVLGEDPEDALLRRFCLDRGIELPLQERHAAHSRALGIRAACEAAAEPGARAHELHLLTELDDLEAWADLVPDLVRLAARRIRMHCILPPPGPRGDGSLHRVEALVRRRRQQRLARWLRRHGVRVTHVARAA